MKVHLRFSKMLLYYIVVYLVVMAVLFFSFYSWFVQAWTWGQYLAVFGVTGIMIGFYALVYFQCYYEINRKYLVFVKFGKQYLYHYNDVVYIDEKQSMKRHVICFYTNKGHTRYLIFDHKNLLYPTMLKHCQNRLTPEAFREEYPKVNL